MIFSTHTVEEASKPIKPRSSIVLADGCIHVLASCYLLPEDKSRKKMNPESRPYHSPVASTTQIQSRFKKKST